MNCCYKGYINDFLITTTESWIDEMIINYKVLCNELPGELQINAWKDCYDKLIINLAKYKNHKLYLVFEYELPHEGGRRPDLIILAKDHVIVVEFKEKEGISRSDLDQVSAYARDIQHYHKFSHNKIIKSLLVPTKSVGKIKEIDDVIACSPDKLEEVLESIGINDINYSPEEWLNSEYEPLPTLVQAAKRIYKDQPLPYIRRANSAGIPQAVEILKEVAQQAQIQGERVLALATGVPGAGKTLLGLQFVYECFNDTENKNSIFLSGNGPLVEVLQNALDSKVFVQPLRNYVKFYGISKRGIPKEHLVVFDEAQRAWDMEHVKEKYNVDASEPDLIISIADSIPDWSVLLGLIGEGQEIHNGEEAGIVQWREAISKSENEWKVVCPSKIAYLFKDVARVVETDKLNLDVSLRSHLAEDVTTWANDLLLGYINKAKELSNRIIDQDFKMYVTRDLNKSKRYCFNRYNGNLEKRYGLVASSKAEILKRYCVDNSYNTTKDLKVGPWFNYGPKNKLSCCKMDKVATEFACQGLELDMPIVCWGEDMIWVKDHWKKFDPERNKAKDPNNLRINSYRVLLTRGRDGFIVYVPDDRRLDGVYDVLVSAGVMKL